MPRPKAHYCEINKTTNFGINSEIFFRINLVLETLNLLDFLKRNNSKIIKK
jgi:hypothetical protein